MSITCNYFYYLSLVWETEEKRKSLRKEKEGKGGKRKKTIKERKERKERKGKKVIKKKIEIKEKKAFYIIT